MLSLPKRGDEIARTGWRIGAVLYLGLAATFVSSLVSSRGESDGALSALLDIVGLGAQPNFILTLLVILGVLVTFVAAVLVWRDISMMAHEEDDIEWVERTGRDGVRLVILPAEDRQRFFASLKALDPTEWRAKIDAFLADERQQPRMRVESLLDSRVELANRAGNDGSALVPEESRLIAEKRTAAYGAFGRYASSLLLLFAVLGTFAGIKAALPGLIAAVSSAGGGGEATSLGGHLRAVADAFGGNALALIGAIALGIMSQAVTLGRRNLLERLELISAEYVYRDGSVSASNPLVSAVESLNRTTREINASTGALLGIESGLEGLGVEFKRSFSALEDRLTAIAEQHESQLYDKTARTLQGLTAQVGNLSEVVAANAGVYRGLVDAVGERAAESRDGAVQLRQANQALASALGSINTASASAVAAMEGTLQVAQQISGATAAVGEQIAGLRTAIQEAEPSLRHVELLLNELAGRVDEMERRSAESWRQILREFGDTVAAIPQRQQEPRAPGRTGDDLAPLLRNISNDLQAIRAAAPSRTVTFAGPVVSALLGGALVLLALR